MFISFTKVRVRYGETDQMGFVYYGNYAQFYEVGRVECMRELGMSYKELEDKGVIMPVLNMNVQYKGPAKYDDLLTIKTIVKELPYTRMKFDYEIYTEDNVLINVGKTELVFLDPLKNRPIAAPEWFVEMIKEKMPI